MIVFCEVVEAAGFSAAAQRLGHSASHVSKEIVRLEDRLGARLLNRTTRTVSLTDDGRIYYEHARRVVDDARDAESAILSVKDKPLGLLRVSVPVSFSLNYLNQWLPEFLDAYPEVNLEIEASDRIVDIVAEGYDVVVRAVGRIVSDTVWGRGVREIRRRMRRLLSQCALILDLVPRTHVSILFWAWFGRDTVYRSCRCRRDLASCRARRGAVKAGRREGRDGTRS